MPIQSGDFTISLSYISSTPNLQAVVGRTVSLNVIFNNFSLTDSLYNLSLTVELPDGVSFSSSSITESSKTTNTNFKEIIKFINIKDLYPNETGFSFTVTLKLDEYLRSNSSSKVQFASVISGIRFSASADTKPRGNLDIENLNVTSLETKSIETFRYSIKFEGPSKFLKGAGEISSSESSATSIINYNLIITNNTLESSNVNLNIDLANGLRYLGNFSVIGTDSSFFLNPTINDVGANDFVSIEFSNKILSTSSVTTLSFDVAIWNKLSINGNENSSSFINNGDILTSNATISSVDSSFSTFIKLEALCFMVTKTLASIYTDINILNEFIIDYEVSAYADISNITLSDTLSDGMSFNTALPLPNSLVNNSDGTTTLLWYLGNLSSSNSQSISFNTITNENYIDLSPVYSTDILTSTLVATFDDPYSTNTLSDSIVKNLFLSAPSINKFTNNYYYNDLTEKIINCATELDFVEFKIIYDASNIDSIQHDVKLYDYPPLNMVMTSVPTYTTTGDFPLTASISLVPDNGFLIELGDLNGGSYFEIFFSIPVTEQSSSLVLSNLCKINLQNSTQNSTSIRSSSNINFGRENIKLSSNLTGPSCVRLGSSFDYILTISNIKDDLVQNICDAFNFLVTIQIPSIFTVESSSVIGSGFYGSISINSNTLSLDIESLAVSQSLDINLSLLTSITPISGLSYSLSALSTRGTTQILLSSTLYSGNDISLIESIKACSITLEKSYSNNTVNRGDIYTVTNTLTIPLGATTYNLKFSDQLVTNNTNFINNVYLDGSLANFSIEDSNIVIPIGDSNSSTNAITHIITYENKILDVTPINFEESFSKDALATWSDYENIISLTATASDTIKVLLPEIRIEKYQRNYTNHMLFTKNDITANITDHVFYKLRLTNIGKAPAYLLSIDDIIDPNLQFVTLLSGNGTFNHTNKTLNITYESLEPSYYVEFLIQTYTKNLTNNLIAQNTASVNYKTNPTLTDYYDTNNSNTLFVLDKILEIKKSQRNLTLDNPFTSEVMSVITGQSFQYKITVKNISSITLSNIIISDYFPSNVEFVSFENFIFGTPQVTSNIITTTINQILPNQTIELIYNLRLSINTLDKQNTMATINFNIPLNVNSFKLESNKLYTDLSSIGRGFKIY